MRPEFTPTLARMYAARAAQLPKPTKWFMAGPFFRAEKPQRGRLREFLQWNVDRLGIPDDAGIGTIRGTEQRSDADADVIAVCVQLLDSVGLSPKDVTVRFSDRLLITEVLSSLQVSDEQLDRILPLLDVSSKLTSDAMENLLEANGFPKSLFHEFTERASEWTQPGAPRSAIANVGVASTISLTYSMRQLNCEEWLRLDTSIVRGLAYYTGTVFEVIADGERAIAGGGRYDNLVELFGGPPTPAVGFGMGDVVLTNLLQDKDLMPSDKDLLDEIGARPDVFLITPEPDLDEHLARTLAHLRKQGLHARRTTKTTRNIGKLLQDASKQHARYAIIFESPTNCSIKNLDSGDEQKAILIESIADHCRPTA
jgi:histidyl-tRNA synthetase